LVKPYILPFVSKLKKGDFEQIGDVEDLRSNQGFYIYRNRRLIVWGEWFRLIRQSELGKLARIRVDIPNTLDSIWKIDIKKSSAQLPDMIKNGLKKIVMDAVGRSEKVHIYRGRKKTSDKLEHLWETIDDRGMIRYSINRNSAMYKAVESQMDGDGLQYLDVLINALEDTFPFMDAYNKMAKRADSVQPQLQDESEVLNNALRLIAFLKTEEGMSEEESVFNVLNIDYFNKYPFVADKIWEELLDDR
jgi:restriction endonuclease